jgi:probable rRNA maturation factor
LYAIDEAPAISDDTNVTVEITASVRRIPHMPTLRRRARRIAAAVGDADIHVALIGDSRMRALNQRFRGVRRTTDVLSFSAPAGSPLQGDIAISVPRARKQARERRLSLLDEVTHLFCHGLLHLKGHDHRTDRERSVMRTEEARLLATVGLPPLPWHDEP